MRQAKNRPKSLSWYISTLEPFPGEFQQNTTMIQRGGEGLEKDIVQNKSRVITKKSVLDQQAQILPALLLLPAVA